MNEQIENTIKSVRGYWFVDGFTEIAAGLLFVLLGALLLVTGHLSPLTFSAGFVTIAGELAAAKVAGILAAILALWWLKDHFTYPRTGFVRSRPVTTAQVSVALRNLLLFLLLPILGVLAVSLLMSSSSSLLATMPVWFPVGVAVVWAALLILLGQWAGIRRFGTLAALTLMAAIGIGGWQLATGLPRIPAAIEAGTLQPPVLESISRTAASLASLVIICGALLLLSGLVTFLRYGKENAQPRAEDA